MLFRSDSITVGWQTIILQVYTQRFLASKVLQYTLEHLEKREFIQFAIEMSSSRCTLIEGIIMMRYKTIVREDFQVNEQVKKK